MEKMHLILITALQDVAGDLAIWSGRDPAEIIALALFKSSLQIKAVGLSEVAKRLRILEPQLAEALESANRLITVVDTSEDEK